MENKIKQLRKGVLELAIMAALGHRAHYGYSLIKQLTGGNGVELTEGTIYPILNRLAREGLISSEWAESNSGPPRKYYSLTEHGRAVYRVVQKEFSMLQKLVAHASDNPQEMSHEEIPTRIEMKKRDKR